MTIDTIGRSMCILLTILMVENGILPFISHLKRMFPLLKGLGSERFPCID